MAQSQTRPEMVRSRGAEPEPESLGAYLLQGAAFLAILLALFMLAGFRF